MKRSNINTSTHQRFNTTSTYALTGLTCNGCVTSVKKKLLSNPEITSAEVSLENQNAIVSSRKRLTIDELQNTIGLDSKYKIHESPNTNTPTPQHLTTNWLITYKPLLIISGFITLVSILAAKGNLMSGMNYFMAGFFLVFSFFKLLDVKGFASSYGMYDIIALKVPAWGFIYPFVELALGILFLTGLYPLATLWATITVMGLSSIGVIRSVFNKQKIRCACLGAVFNLPMSTVTIIEDLLMVAMAAGMLFLI